LTQTIKKYALNKDGTINGTGEVIIGNTPDMCSIVVDKQGNIFAPLIYSNKILVVDTNKVKHEFPVKPSLNEVIGVILKEDSSQKILYLSPILAL